MSDKTMGEIAREAYHTACNVDLSELDEWWECVKEGDALAWQAAADAVAAPLLAELSELRHALANAQVAAGFAREQAERVKVLEAEVEYLQSQVPHYGDGACDFCGTIPSFPIPTVVCSECSQFVVHPEKIEQRGFLRGLERAEQIAHMETIGKHPTGEVAKALDSVVAYIRSEAAKPQP